MDRLILGDNQFFGINHMSEGRGMQSLARFQDTAEIIRVLDQAWDLGIHAFTFSTHERVAQICDHFRSQPQRYADLRLYPALPYAHKYAEVVNQKGLPAALVDMTLKNNSVGGVASMLLKGGMGLLTKDVLCGMEVLVDTEMRMFQRLPVRAVFLQNIVTDMLVGLGWPDAFRRFHEHIRRSWDAEAGFMTLNLPRTVDFLLAAGIERPIVCSPINRMGFQMNPDRASCEATLATRPVRAFAMSVMAAGSIPPREAFSYVLGLPAVESIVFGASSARNIENTRQIIDELDGQLAR
jgi:hypothetical protein